jgi:hypothetical protein
VSVDGAVMRHLTQICERRASAATEAEAVRCSRPASADQANARKISSAEGPEMTECRPGAGGANETQITAKLLNAASLETRPTQRRPARSTGVPVAPASARSKHVRRTAPLLAHSVAPAVQLYSQEIWCPGFQAGKFGLRTQAGKIEPSASIERSSIIIRNLHSFCDLSPDR